MLDQAFITDPDMTSKNSEGHLDCIDHNLQIIYHVPKNMVAFVSHDPKWVTWEYKLTWNERFYNRGNLRFSTQWLFSGVNLHL